MFKRFILLLPAIFAFLAASGLAAIGADWMTGGDADTSKDILSLRQMRIVGVLTAACAYLAKSPAPRLIARIIYGDAVEPAKVEPQ